MVHRSFAQVGWSGSNAWQPVTGNRVTGIAGCRRNVRPVAESGAAQLADGASRLHRAAPFDARPDQQVERQEPEAAIRRGDWRHIA